MSDRIIPRITPRAAKLAEEINEYVNSLRAPPGDVIAALVVVLGGGVFANNVDGAAALAMVADALSERTQGELSQRFRAHTN